MYSVYASRFFTVRVSPFGHLRVEAYLQLTAAFRSLSRPSSAPDAKAFTLCSCSLELSFASSSLYFELLEFHKTNNFDFGFLVTLSEKVLSFSLFVSCFPPFGEIVILPKLERPLDLAVSR